MVEENRGWGRGEQGRGYKRTGVDKENRGVDENRGGGWREQRWIKRTRERGGGEQGRGGGEQGRDGGEQGREEENRGGVKENRGGVEENWGGVGVG
jgi:hypothetical protein